MLSKALQEKLQSIPNGPGVYLFKDRKERIIYVGKAKSLRNRVRSYFQDFRHLDERKYRMMGYIADVEFTVTDTEGEALALENNLIKENKPKYNVLLRDDKTYPYIKLTVNEPYPKALITRRVRKDGALYFGPFFPAGLARKTLRLVERHFLIRNCNIHIDGKRPRPCLQYYIHRCLAPCVEKLVSSSRYKESVNDVRLFLEGKGPDLVKRLKQQMDEAAQEKQYELAAHYRDALRTIEQITERQKMALISSDDIDIFGFQQEGPLVAVSSFHMRKGKVVNKKELFWEDQHGFDAGNFFGALLKLFYMDAPFIPVEIHVPVPFEDQALLAIWLSTRKGRKVEIRTPRRGGKRRMMELVHRNARLAFSQRFRSTTPSAALIAKELEETLDLEKTPRRIEAFDVSNLQGSDIVASMVSWCDGKPNKREYRRFVVRSVTGKPDDFKSLREVVGRRYSRLIAENKAMPDLILIDGGVGQLHAAQAALDDLNIVDQPLASIAKRKELIYIAGRENEPVVLERRSLTLRLIQQIRDESHRFAINFHRDRRLKRQRKSELDEIPRIGPMTARKLLDCFGSLKRVREATIQELLEVANRPQAESIWQHFHS